MTTEAIMTAEARSPQTRLACSAMAWDCQEHTFFGSPETVTANLSALPDELVQRRVFMLTIQVDGRAEARFFERFSLEDTDGTVEHWENDELGDLHTQITEVLVANKGVHCPGEQVKSAIQETRDFIVEGPSPAPKTAAEAFGSVLRDYAGEKFVQASVMAFC